MSVWLCRQEPVKRPLYISELDLRVYSSQELSYVILQYPLLALTGLVDERLFAFIKEQLDLGFLALKMERLKRSGGSDDEVLGLFLQEADYCLPAEIAAFRQQAGSFKKMPPASYRKERADYLIRIGQYHKALSVYQKILEMPRDTHINDGFLGMIFHNMGTCYARLLQYEEAAKAYEKSYFYAKDPAVLKRLYFLGRVAPGLELSERGEELLKHAGVLFAGSSGQGDFAGQGTRPAAQGEHSGSQGARPAVQGEHSGSQGTRPAVQGEHSGNQGARPAVQGANLADQGQLAPAQWETEYQAAYAKARESEGLAQLEELFGRDPIRRHQSTGQMISEWKKQYRRMQKK